VDELTDYNERTAAVRESFIGLFGCGLQTGMWVCEAGCDVEVLTRGRWAC
jgi:hypothetical protein